MAGIRIGSKAKVTIIGGDISRNVGGGIVVDGDGILDISGGARIAENYGDGIAVNGDDAEIKVADSTIEKNGFEMASDILRVDCTVVDEAQLMALIDKTIELKGKAGSEEELRHSVLDWMNLTGIITTVASAEPFIALISAVVALGVSNLKQLKQKLGGHA